MLGVAILGSESHVFGDNTWQMYDKIVNDLGNSSKHHGGGFFQGALITGKSSTVFTRTRGQDGLLLLGGYNAVTALNNSGVIIAGTTHSIFPTEYDEDGVASGSTEKPTYKRHTDVRGAGIFIRGSECDEKGVWTKGSLIQGSSHKKNPTILKGNFKLDSDFQLQNSSGQILIDAGKVKEMVTTINELKERVEKLENTSS